MEGLIKGIQNKTEAEHCLWKVYGEVEWKN